MDGVAFWNAPSLQALELVGTATPVCRRWKGSIEGPLYPYQRSIVVDALNDFSGSKPEYPLRRDEPFEAAILPPPSLNDAFLGRLIAWK
jgi:hypothetical protein